MPTTKLPLHGNKNTDWIDSMYFYWFYCFLITVIFLGVETLPSHAKILGSGLTTINVLHGIVSFFMFHWMKGSPDQLAQGDYNHLTFYEQIDAGIPWTRTKKFLMMIPTFLLIIASVATNYNTVHLLVNFPVWVVLIVAKLPELHSVRLFGINSTVGIDDDDNKQS